MNSEEGIGPLREEDRFRRLLEGEIAVLKEHLRLLRDQWSAFSGHPPIPSLRPPFEARWRREWAPVEAPAIAFDRYDVLSLDIFDTCLRRICGEPAAVFRMLGEDLLRAGAPVEDFASRRAEAEGAIRKRLQEAQEKEDVTLEEIYEELGRRLAWDPETVSRWKERESLLERGILVPNPALRELAKTAREAGLDVIYVSEMYLPAEILAGFLKRAGFPVSPEAIFVSGETGLSKGSGNLYRHVRERFGNRRICHVGDNPETDVETPKPHAIDVRPVRRVMPKYADPLSGVFFELSLARDGAAGFWENLGYRLVGPMATAWMRHALREVRKRDLSQIAFLTRDGFFPRLAFDRLAGKADPSVTGLTLFSSRRLFGLAAMDRITREDWDFLLKPAPRFRIRDFFDRVNIPPAEYEPVCRASGINPEEVVCHHRGFDDPRTKDRLFELFSPLMDTFYRGRDALRERVLAYLDSLGLRPGRFGIVDIGWNGSSFRNLERLCGSGFVGAGLFFGIWRESRAGTPGADRLAPFFISGDEASEEEHLIRGGVGLLEFLMGSPEDSVADVHYHNGEWRPLHTPVLGDRERTAYAGLEKGLEAFLDDFESVGGHLVDGDGKGYLQDALGRLLYDPREEEVEQLGRVTHVEGWGSARRLRLLPDMSRLENEEARRLAYAYSAWKGAWSRLK